MQHPPSHYVVYRECLAEMQRRDPVEGRRDTRQTEAHVDFYVSQPSSIELGELLCFSSFFFFVSILHIYDYSQDYLHCIFSMIVLRRSGNARGGGTDKR
jgi:hypothetical protein